MTLQLRAIETTNLEQRVAKMEKKLEKLMRAKIAAGGQAPARFPLDVQQIMAGDALSHLLLASLASHEDFLDPGGPAMKDAYRSFRLRPLYCRGRHRDMMTREGEENRSRKLFCSSFCVLLRMAYDVYTYCIYITIWGVQMGTARVFRSGNSQAVRLPKQFRFKTKEVEIFRRGNEIVLREKPRDMVRAFELLATLPDDFEIRGRPTDQPQRRKGL